MNKSVRVYLTLKTKEEAAREVAETVMMRANPHDSVLTARCLGESGVNTDNLSRYFIEVSKAVAEFWHSNWDTTVRTTLKPHELRSLYLPLVYGVIFSSVGNMTIGNYEYLVKSVDCGTIDKEFLFSFSAALNSVRQYVKCSDGQIGNRAVSPQTSTMMTILGTNCDDRSTEVNVRDGVNTDDSLRGLAALAGISLIEEAYRILFTGVEEVNFRQVTETLIDKGLVAARTNPDNVG